MRPFDVNARPGRAASVGLAALPFVIGLLAYVLTAHVRHLENPQDKVVPKVSQMVDGFQRTAFEPDRKGEYRLLADTAASAKRFVLGVALLFPAIVVGLYMGLFPFFERLFLRFVLFFDKIPALAVLPILFIVFGLGETSKLALIVLGVFPTIALDSYLRAKAIPRQQIIKGLTLGASNLEIAHHIVLPQIFPDVLDTIRLNFKAVILYVIAGESLAATVGLGYRIFLVRRYIAMDIIIPYVVWMSVLALLADLMFRLWIRHRHGWRVAT